MVSSHFLRCNHTLRTVTLASCSRLRQREEKFISRDAIPSRRMALSELPSDLHHSPNPNTAAVYGIATRPTTNRSVPLANTYRKTALLFLTLSTARIRWHNLNVDLGGLILSRIYSTCAGETIGVISRSIVSLSIYLAILLRYDDEDRHFNLLCLPLGNLQHEIRHEIRKPCYPPSITLNNEIQVN